MSDPCCTLHRSQISSSAFLLSQSDICQPLPAHGPGTDESAAQSLKALADLHEPFIPPEQLQETAMQRLADEKSFSVLVIRMDHFSQTPEPDALIGDAAAAARQACIENEGFWGVFDADKLACFFAKKDEQAGLDIARNMQESPEAKLAGTLTIGVAAYPALDYEKSEILINAQKALEHAEFFGPGSTTAFDSVSLNVSGDKYYQAGDVKGAIVEFKRALELDPENVNVLNSLGVCYGVNQELEPALECFKKAAELEPAEIMVLYNAGYVHMCRGENEKALEYFQKAGQIDSGVFEVAFQTGRVHMEGGRPDTARKFLESAVSINEKSGAAFRYLADCYMQLDRDLDAAAAYKTALKLRPDDAEALSILGYLYEMQGKNADIALMFCQRAVEMVPDNGLFRHRLGRVYFYRNCCEQALEEFQAACDCGHDSFEYLALSRDMTTDKDQDLQVQG